ncbi:MAG: SAM-dependent methyltransferase [Fibrobacteres bacterium]|nr:SAM-dependent methyltransferase [Fibrobacterota bacterium]
MRESDVSVVSVPVNSARSDAAASTPPDKSFVRLVNLLRKVCGDYFESGRGMPCDLQWRNDKPYRFGQGEPEFTVIVKDKAGVSAISSLDGTAFLEAYALDHIEIRGSMEKMFAFRDMTTDKHPVHYIWNLVQPLLFGQTKMDRSGISTHYDNSKEFYLNFLDRRHRCYSQGVFLRDDESLEDAMTRKMEFAVDSIGVKPGDRVLDIGGGWGAFNEHAGKKGIRVTSLTISKESEKFLQEMIDTQKLPCEVVNRHLYEFDPGMKFDAIVNLGVTEHLPDYGKSLAIYQKLLKPGGKMYLDASACREKYKFHTFITKHIYPGNCSPLCLHDYMTQLSKTPFMLRGVWDDRQSYYLTAKHWSLNLEKNREEIVRNGDESLFRKFQVYLWGTADVFRRDIMQAYRWVLELP